MVNSCMYFPDFQEFSRRAARGNLVPVYREILGDTETPVTAYRKLGVQPSFLLESVIGGEKWGRYSFIGTGGRVVLRGTGNDPFPELKETIETFRPVPAPELPRFFGGLVGYLGYDVVRHIEELPDMGRQGPAMPDYYFMLTDTLLIFDSFSQKITVIHNAHIDERPLEEVYTAACRAVDESIRRLQEPSTGAPSVLEVAETGAGGDQFEFRSSFPERADFEDAVRRCKEYIRAGDIFQVVLSQRFETPYGGDPFDVYRALRVITPSPYMYFLDTGEAQIAGSSPEILVRLEDGRIELRPIAGTRPRGASAAEDADMEADLLNDPKERAEHLMLVDLGRNDVGRVAEVGSVNVTEFQTIERYSHVMHMVSNVKGKLRPNLTAVDLIQATFPAGTVSGAPKVRAMEIIEELEPQRRGPYAGALGYLSFSGNLDMCITIRTIVVKDGVASIQAGAGIVADSDPAREYDETVNKARGMMKAIRMAGQRVP